MGLCCVKPIYPLRNVGIGSPFRNTLGLGRGRTGGVGSLNRSILYHRPKVLFSL